MIPSALRVNPSLTTHRQPARPATGREARARPAVGQPRDPEAAPRLEEDLSRWRRAAPPGGVGPGATPLDVLLERVAADPELKRASQEAYVRVRPDLLEQRRELSRMVAGARRAEPGLEALLGGLEGHLARLDGLLGVRPPAGRLIARMPAAELPPEVQAELRFMVDLSSAPRTRQGEVDWGGINATLAKLDADPGQLEGLLGTAPRAWRVIARVPAAVLGPAARDGLLQSPLVDLSSAPRMPSNDVDWDHVVLVLTRA